MCEETFLSTVFKFIFPNINSWWSRDHAQETRVISDSFLLVCHLLSKDLDITEVWKSEDKNFLRKRGINCYECYGEGERKTKVKKSKRSVSHGYFSAYGTGALSPVNCHIAQCSPCNPCLDGKIMCSCYASAMYGVTTPPPSPSIECNTAYDERMECSVPITASLSPHSSNTTMNGQVWRPWLK